VRQLLGAPSLHKSRSTLRLAAYSRRCGQLDGSVFSEAGLKASRRNNLPILLVLSPACVVAQSVT